MFCNSRDDNINRQGVTFRFDDDGRPVLHSTRVEIYYKLLFSYPKISQVTECKDNKGNTYFDYDFDFDFFDLDNIFRMCLDKVEIVGYSYMNKERGIIRIGYRWLNVGNALDWSIKNLIDLIRPNLFHCFTDCEDSPTLTYELSEDGYTSYLYCDLGYRDYRTDYYTILYIDNFYSFRYEDIETSTQEAVFR